MSQERGIYTGAAVSIGENKKDFEEEEVFEVSLEGCPV